jgi:hypothetical protein
MYSNTAAEIRPDLQAVVEEASAADRFFISQVVLPVKFSKRRVGDYHKLTLSKTESMKTDLGDSTLRAPKTAYKEVDRTYEKDTFTTVDRGLEEVVDDSDAADVAPSFDAEALASKLTLRNIMLAQEYRTQAAFMNGSTFAATAASVAYTEANIATIDIALDIEAAIARVQKRGELVNAIIMARPVWSRCRRSTLLRKFLFGDLGGNSKISLKEFGAAFSESGLITPYVAEASYDATKKGQTTIDANLAYIWPNTYVWVGRIAEGVDRTAPVTSDGGAGIITLPDGGVGLNIVWEEQADGLYVTETYRDEKRRSDVVRVRQYGVEKIMNANAGTLITTSYA